MQPVPLDEYPIHQAPLSMRLRRHERPQLLRPLLLQRPRPHRRHVLHHRARRVPEPRRRSTRTRPSHAATASTVGAASPTRSATTGSTSASAVPHRGHRAAAADPAGAATPTSTGLGVRPHLGGLVPGGRRSSRTSCAAGPRVDPRRLALRPGRHVGGRAPRSTATRSPSPRTRGSAAATGRGASGRSARAEPPGAPPTSRLEGFWWLYVPLRFDDFAHRDHRAGGARRLPHAERRHRVWPDGRVEQLGWPEIDIALPLGHPHPERAHDPPAPSAAASR